MKYTVEVIVEVHARNASQAYHFIKKAIDAAKMANLVIVDMEYTKREEEVDEEEESAS
jgi:dihydroorotase-like cyclic amidohydrolase